MLDAYADELESPRNQRTDGGLIVALHDQLGMAEPLNDLDDEACNKVLFISSFAWYDVCKYAFGASASDGHALNSLARGSRGFELGFAIFILRVVQFFALLDLVALDEEVVAANHGDG